MGRSRTSRLKEPALLSEQWDSAPEREPLSFLFSRATGTSCINSTRAVSVTAHACQPAANHENKQRVAGDFDARYTLPVTDRRKRGERQVQAQEYKMNETRKRSSIWMHFDQCENTKAKCRMYNSKISYRAGSTHNLHRLEDCASNCSVGSTEAGWHSCFCQSL